MSSRRPILMNLVTPRPPVWLRYPVVLPVMFVVGTLVGLIGRSALPALLLPALAAALTSRARRARLRRRTAAQRSAVVALCSALRAELEGGALPNAALAEAVWCRVELRDLAESVGALHMSQSPRTSPTARASPTALSAPAHGYPGTAAELLAVAALAAPGRGGLSGLAACWRATEEHGLPLASAVAGIESALRAEEQRQLLLDAELSGVRTTMGLLAVLPAFGLLLGSSLGARPWHTLLQTFGGQICLVLGSALEMTGLWWTDRLVAGVADLAAPSLDGSPATSRRWGQTCLGCR
jgi:tight adherence protein B